MTAVPATPVEGVEYRASKYEVQIEPYFYSIFQWVMRSPTTQETRHLVTAYMPVPTDRTVTKIVTGTKDYYLLNDLSKNSAAVFGRTVDLENLINFSSYWWLRWRGKRSSSRAEGFGSPGIWRNLPYIS